MSLDPPTRDAQERACRAASLDHAATSKPPWVSDAEIELVAYTSQGALTFRFSGVAYAEVALVVRVLCVVGDRCW